MLDVINLQIGVLFHEILKAIYPFGKELLAFLVIGISGDRIDVVEFLTVFFAQYLNAENIASIVFRGSAWRRDIGFFLFFRFIDIDEHVLVFRVIDLSTGHDVSGNRLKNRVGESS